MRIPVVALLALTLLHTVSTITTTAASAQEERAAVGAILALDTAVQKRFEKVDRRFGLSRLPLPKGAHGFAPENDAELSSLHELEEANVRVVLYLGGRKMLGAGPDERRERWSDQIKGPAFITRERSLPIPSAEALSEEGSAPSPRSTVTNSNTYSKSNAGTCWHGQSEQSTARA